MFTNNDYETVIKDLKKVVKQTEADYNKCLKIINSRKYEDDDLYVVCEMFKLVLEELTEILNKQGIY